MPAIAVGVVVATWAHSPQRLSLLALVIGAAVVRIAGERAWSLLPQAILAATLIDPGSWRLWTVMALVASAVATAIRPDRVQDVVANLTSAIAALTLALVSSSLVSEPLRAGSLDWHHGMAMLSLGLAWFLIDTVIWTVRQPNVTIVYRDVHATLLRDSRVAVIMISATLACAAIWHHSPVWATLTSALSLLLASRLADQVRRHRVLVDLTVQALGRLPEAAGVVQRSHSKNVTELAVAMGRVQGLAGRDLETLRRAALLHDVGLLSATKPEIGEGGFLTSDISEWGAELLASNEEFRRETTVIRQMSLPYRSPGADPTEGDAARLIRVACRAISMLEVDPVEQVVESLYAESVYTFDPQAIALIRPAIRLLGWPALPELN
jgi:hypothetical protein